MIKILWFASKSGHGQFQCKHALIFYLIRRGMSIHISGKIAKNVSDYLIVGGIDMFEIRTDLAVEEK